MKKLNNVKVVGNIFDMWDTKGSAKSKDHSDYIRKQWIQIY